MNHWRDYNSAIVMDNAFVDRASRLYRMNPAHLSNKLLPIMAETIGYTALAFSNSFDEELEAETLHLHSQILINRYLSILKERYAQHLPLTLSAAFLSASIFLLTDLKTEKNYLEISDLIHKAEVLQRKFSSCEVDSLPFTLRRLLWQTLSVSPDAFALTVAEREKLLKQTETFDPWSAMYATIENANLSRFEADFHRQLRLQAYHQFYAGRDRILHSLRAAL